MKIFQKLLISSVATSFLVPVLAQDTLKITVTGTRSERPVETFPGSIDVIDQEDIQSKNTADVIDILDDLPGVSFENIFSSKSGFKGGYDGGNVNIRGVDRNRVLMMVDGIRLPEQYFFGDYYVLGRANYVNFDTLKAVEVFKGPASSLYGSDALGGLVYFRSLSPNDILEDGKNTTVIVPASYNSANNGFKESIKLATKFSENSSGLFIFTREDSSEYKVKAANKYLDNESKTGNNIFTNLEFGINDNSKLNIIGEFINRESDIKMASGNLDVLGYTKKDTNSITIRDRVSLSYNFKSPNSSSFIDEAKASIFNQYARIEDNFDRVVGSRDLDHDYYLKNDSFGGEVQLESSLNDSHNLTYGLEYNSFESSRLRKTITNTTGAVENKKDQPDTTTKRFGIYLQDEVSYGKFDFIVGVRYDNYNLDAQSDSIFVNSSDAGTPLAADHSSDAFSPSIVASYNWNPNLSTYAKYAKGFRAPSYMEINSSRNPGYYTTLSNPDLKAETSNTYEIGLKHNSKKHNFAASAFLSEYEDFIEAYKLVGPGAIYKSVNASNAEIWGGELSSTYYLNEARYGTSFLTTFAFAQGDNTTDDEPLETVQPFNGKFSIRYNTEDDKWLHALTINYVGEPRVKSGTTTFVPDSYVTLDLTTKYRYSENFDLSAGLYNLTDERYYNYQNVKGLATDLENLTRYSQPGTSVRIGFNWKF